MGQNEEKIKILMRRVIKPNNTSVEKELTFGALVWKKVKKHHLKIIVIQNSRSLFIEGTRTEDVLGHQKDRDKWKLLSLCESALSINLVTKPHKVKALVHCKMLGRRNSTKDKIYFSVILLQKKPEIPRQNRTAHRHQAPFVDWLKETITQPNLT